MTKNTILLLTDFSYEAKGREYFREDLFLSNFLRKYFNVCIAHIEDAHRILNAVDAVVIRNTGPKSTHAKFLMALKQNKNLLLFNDLLGKGDILGKSHLELLFKAKYPVIPTFTSIDELNRFGSFKRYLLKPIDGADSCGVKILTHQELLKETHHNFLIQPLIDFQYEVSFYFIGKEFQYALYAKDPKKRWELALYNSSREDIDFALKFIDWNTCERGIQRVDACRLQDGTLLLMELEDYNPYLSLDLLDPVTRNRFLELLCTTIEKEIKLRK